MKKHTFKLVISLLTVSVLSACTGNKTQTDADNLSVGSVEDITLPPQTITGRKEVKERNPEETISFDEWRKRRIEELKQDQ